MFKIFASLVCFYLTIASIVGSRKNNNVDVITTKKAIVPLLGRFHQNDYQLTYDWGETVRMESQLVNYTATVFKYNRTVTVTNFIVLLKIDLEFDLEVIIQIYKFASNKYRLFPVRFEVNVCEAITKQIMGVNKFIQCVNFSCPLLKKKTYHVWNWRPEESKFPPFIPTGKYMRELQYLFRSREVLVIRGYGTIYRPITAYED